MSTPRLFHGNGTAIVCGVSADSRLSAWSAGIHPEISLRDGMVAIKEKGAMTLSIDVDRQSAVNGKRFFCSIVPIVTYCGR